jgi:hypothetical protein
VGDLGEVGEDGTIGVGDMFELSPCLLTRLLYIIFYAKN